MRTRFDTRTTHQDGPSISTYVGFQITTSTHSRLNDGTTFLFKAEPIDPHHVHAIFKGPLTGGNTNMNLVVVSASSRSGCVSFHETIVTFVGLNCIPRLLLRTGKRNIPITNTECTTVSRGRRTKLMSVFPTERMISRYNERNNLYMDLRSLLSIGPSKINGRTYGGYKWERA